MLWHVSTYFDPAGLSNILNLDSYRAGIDPREQRLKNTFLDSLAKKRQEEESGDVSQTRLIWVL